MHCSVCTNFLVTNADIMCNCCVSLVCPVIRGADIIAQTRIERKRVTEPPSPPAPKRTAIMTEQSRKEAQAATSLDFGQCNA